MSSTTRKIPVIKHYKGVCHVFVDATAELEMAENICYNAKVQRPGVCNAMETLLVHRGTPRTPRYCREIARGGGGTPGCARTRQILPRPKGRRRGGLVRRVPRPDPGDRWSRTSTRPSRISRATVPPTTEAIVTADYANAQRFLNEVASSTVLVNASTRFSDGYELGLGAEIGISTTKLHAFGPMGVEELTTTKFIISGMDRSGPRTRRSVFSEGPLIPSTSDTCAGRGDQRVFSAAPGHLHSAAHPPHKAGKILSPPLRVEMVRLAIADNPRFSLSDVEIRRPGKSYSIETITYFREQFGPETHLYFIVGLDAFLEIETWKDIQPSSASAISLS